MNKTGWMSAQHREDTRLGLAELHKSPAGQQILTLFRIKGMAPSSRNTWKA